MPFGLSFSKKLRIVAILAVRNEEKYLARCLKHLRKQGVASCIIIDNGSTDRTPEIIRSFDQSFVFRTMHYPYPGYFDWEGILRLKQQLAAEVSADWFIHIDADEILESPWPGKTLVNAIGLVDRKGYNTINFNEFVFVPTHDNEQWEDCDYVSGMKNYYFFEPRPQRLLRAWKRNNASIDLASSGGHNIMFKNRKIFPESFILRHYITLSRAYMIEKYCKRKFSPKEIEKGWHYPRIGITPDMIQLPHKDRLKKYRNNGIWDTSEPWHEHFFSALP
jgi:glycosyltransferase involved in cell wall biosynthesis